MLVAIIIMLGLMMIGQLIGLLLLAVIVINTDPKKKQEQQKKEFEALGNAIVDFYK